MEEDNYQEHNSLTKSNSIKSNDSAGKIIFTFLWELFSILFVFLVLLWNIDAVWQTDIKFLKNIQKTYFSQKYIAEQLKISRIQNNNELIEDIQIRLDRTVKKYQSEIDAITIEKEQAEKLALQAQEQLEAYLEKENNKCRYYQTALMIIKNLRKHYSEAEIQEIITCTNPECIDIMSFKTEAFDVCTK